MNEPIECGYCKSYGIVNAFGWGGDMESYLLNKGWRFHVDYGWICPDCVRKGIGGRRDDDELVLVAMDREHYEMLAEEFYKGFQAGLEGGGEHDRTNNPSHYSCYPANRDMGLHGQRD